MKRKKALISSLVVVSLLGGYAGSWLLLPKLGLVSPMANLRYFYYGEYKGISDHVLYVAYYPLYRCETGVNHASRYGIHWSDRNEPNPPTLEELIEAGTTEEDLKGMGYTEDDIKNGKAYWH